MIDYILSPQSVEALGWTLLHSLWQGGVFAILLVLILIALRKYTAQSRYVVSVGLLCAFFLTVSATFWQQWQDANHRVEYAALQLNKPQVEDAFVIDNPSEEVLPSLHKGINYHQLNSEVLVSEQSSWLISFRDYYDRHLPLLVTIWFIGILFLQLRFLGQLAYVQRLKHYGTQLFPASWRERIEELEGKLRIQKKVSYLTSMRIESPMVIGWLKPAVLLPQQLFSHLSETEIYTVLAHELAHIRREDFIINLLQTFLCNVFFFHPGVWWMSHRIDDEREHCCDDLAVAATGPVTSYSKTLINVSELQLKIKGNPALAMAFSGKSKRERGGFSGRIRRLFMVSNGAGTFREGFATACILITALFLGIAATGPTVQEIDLTNPLLADEIKIGSQNINNEKLINKERSNTITKSEENPISKVRQIVDQRQRPISGLVEEKSPIEQAAITEDIAPTEPIAPMMQVRPGETRIDALVMACGEGDLEFVKTLINSGIDINGIGEEGLTPLMMATNNDEVDVVEYLLKQGADVNQTHNGWTALIEAADEGSLASMEYLLRVGAEVNFYATPASPTAISMAASEGNLECLKLLIKNGADINGIGRSVPPLHMAAEEGQRDILSYLISKGVKLDKKDAYGHTALMYAASEGHKYSVMALVKAGANIIITDNNDLTASDYADEEEHYGIRDYLSKEKIPYIHQATSDGLIEKVERMVENGSDVNTRDDMGRTPLHIASALNHNIDMRVLINLGADINAQDKQGRTPLMYAAADGKADAVALLASEQADVNIEDVDGMKASDWGRSGGNVELATFLRLITKNEVRTNNRETRAENEDQRRVQEKDHEKRVQTNEKYRNKQEEDRQRLKEKSAQREEKRVQEQEKRRQKRIETDVQNEIEADIHTDIHTNVHTHVNTVTNDSIDKKETLHVAEGGYHVRQYDIEEKIPELFEAVRYGSKENISKLLNNGISVNAADDAGQTALMVASMTNRIDIADFLIKQGADVNQSSNSGLTALHYTALENYVQMARLLLKSKAQVDPKMRYSSTDGNYNEEPIVWEYIGATPLLIAVESGNIEVLSVFIQAGADVNLRMTKKEYRLNKDRVTYLSASEVMGLDEDFLKQAKIKITDDAWTPYKQALLSNEKDILTYFPKN